MAAFFLDFPRSCSVHRSGSLQPCSCPVILVLCQWLLVGPGVDPWPKLDQSASSSGSLAFSRDRGQRSQWIQGHALKQHFSHLHISQPGSYSGADFVQVGLGRGLSVYTSSKCQVMPMLLVLRPHFEKQGPIEHTLFSNRSLLIRYPSGCAFIYL